MKKQSYFLFLITMLCLAIAGSNTSFAQITKEGIKIRLFEKNDKGKSKEIKDISSILESGLMCCSGDCEFDRIELGGKGLISIIIRDGFTSDEGGVGEIVYENKDYNLSKKAIFKPFEQMGHGRFTVYIMKDDMTLLQFEYELLSCT